MLKATREKKITKVKIRTQTHGEVRECDHRFLNTCTSRRVFSLNKLTKKMPVSEDIESGQITQCLGHKSMPVFFF